MVWEARRATLRSFSLDNVNCECKVNVLSLGSLLGEASRVWCGQLIYRVGTGGGGRGGRVREEGVGEDRGVGELFK